MKWLGLLLIIVLALIYVDGSRKGETFLEALNPFDNASTTQKSTDQSLADRILNREKDSPDTPQKTTPPTNTSNQPAIDSEEVEKEVEEILKEVEKLEEDVKNAKLYEPRSPYADMVTLKAGTAKNTDPEREHVLLTANSSNSENINITGWYLESYVTESEGEIQLGARDLNHHNTYSDEPILLHPGELAYIITGETPLRVSFRENKCTGYLAEYGDFYPSLKKSCPLPSDELLVYGEEVDEDDDDCAEYVDSISRCEIVDEDELDDAKITNSCEAFIERVLDYEGCVARHDEDADFYTGGTWRIYLEKERELWRSTGEIIRLFDKQDRVIAVIEY